MEIIRCINGKKVEGDVPSMKVENEGVAMVIRDLQARLASEDATKYLQGKSRS